VRWVTWVKQETRLLPDFASGLAANPLKEEIDAACQEVIRRAYADMALAAVSFLEENDPQPLPSSLGSEQPTISRAIGTSDVVPDE